MPKICGGSESASGTVRGFPCIASSLGNCTGRYELLFAIDPVFDVTSGEIVSAQDITARQWQYYESEDSRYIKGQIFCVTEARKDSAGRWTTEVGSNHPSRANLRQFTNVILSGAFSNLPQPKFVGLRYLEDELCDLDGNCKCTGGDEAITCSSAEGGICCIPKSLLDDLCAKV